MNKYFVVFMAMFLLGGHAFANAGMSGEGHRKKDCVMMKDGKMFVLKDGQKTMMDANITMPNGTMVMKDGTLMMKDGSTKMMNEGDSMDKDGNMMKRMQKAKTKAK